MNLKNQFKKTFSYTWYLYLIALVVPCVAFPLAYSFMHRPQEYEKLSIFLSCNVGENDFSRTIEKAFKDKGVRSVEVVSSDPNDNEYMYLQKLNVVGVNKCDVLIIPESMVSSLDPKGSMIEFNEDIKNRCNVSSESFYNYLGLDYGVTLTDVSPLKAYGFIKSEVKYYAFLGGKSWNVGEYSTSVPNTTNAFDFMRYIVGK